MNWVMIGLHVFSVKKEVEIRDITQSHDATNEHWIMICAIIIFRFPLVLLVSNYYLKYQEDIITMHVFYKQKIGIINEVV
jgi:hypothetical protein